MVKIFLGPKRKRYTVHSGLVCASSNVFKSHFGDPHKLSTKVLYLNDFDPTAFTKYVHFLYHKELEPITVPIVPKIVNGTTVSVHQQKIDETSVLLRLHNLADTLGIPPLKNLVLDRLNHYMDDARLVFTASQIKDIWQSTAGNGGGPTHPLRRFAVDQFIFHMLNRQQSVKVRQSYLKPLINAATRDFVLEVVEAVIWTKKYPAPTNPKDKGKCAYHVHGKGEKCPD